jgi:hydroxymethylpyrimidine pyrophosphatase-like HAD family hydrolase
VHPKFNRPYTDLIFQPMLELLAYLRANGFRTFIVSGGGVEFMRVWVEKVYGIPPEQVIGSSIVTKFEMLAGLPVLRRLPQLDFMDDNVGKPVGINKHIGRRPIAAFGNSDGDLQMLQWTTASKGSSFALLVNHTDSIREYAYQVGPMGKLDVALTDAKARGWTVVDMKRDWNRIYPFEDGV